MSKTFQFGNGEWAVGKETALAYNDENSNFKPLPFTFDRSTGATVVNKDGLIEKVGIDEPRIDFLNNTKGHLLLEPERRNTLPYSQDFSQWSATSGGSVVSDQEGIGGSSDAFEFVSDGSANSRIFYTISATGVHSFSVFAKKNTLDFIALYANDDNNGRVWYNLANGTLGNQEGNATGAIEDYGNGWYRCTLKWTSSNLVNVRIYNSNANDVFGGTAGSVFIQYAQLEAGSYATSYIPTQGSAVTRSVEQGIDGGAGAPVFSNTSAVWFVDLERIGVDTDSSGSAMALRNSSFSQQIRLHFDAPTTNIRFRDGLNGFATISTITGMSAGVRKKIALRIDGSALSTFANGSKIGSDYTAPSTFDIAEIDFATLGFKLHDMKFYNTALTDEELIALTS